MNSNVSLFQRIFISSCKITGQKLQQLWNQWQDEMRRPYPLDNQEILQQHANKQSDFSGIFNRLYDLLELEKQYIVELKKNISVKLKKIMEMYIFGKSGFLTKLNIGNF